MRVLEAVRRQCFMRHDILKHVIFYWATEKDGPRWVHCIWKNETHRQPSTISFSRVVGAGGGGEEQTLGEGNNPG